MTQWNLLPLIYNLFRAVCTDLPGRKPWLLSKNIFSQIISKINCIAFCTIFSLGEPIPNGLFPLFSFFSIIILLAGPKSYLPANKFWPKPLNQARSIPSNVSQLVPFVIFPGLPFNSS